MSADATQVRIAPNGRLLVAALESTVPTDTTSPWDSAWKDLGYADETGVAITPGLTTVEIKAWQAASPIAVLPTEVKYELKFVLQQFNALTTGLFFGGSEWNETAATVKALVKFTPAAVGGANAWDYSGTPQTFTINDGTGATSVTLSTALTNIAGVVAAVDAILGAGYVVTADTSKVKIEAAVAGSKTFVIAGTDAAAITGSTGYVNTPGTGSGVYKLIVPSSPSLDKRMLGIEWDDGEVTNRLVVAHGLVTARDQLNIVRSKNQAFGVTFTALDLGGELATVLSDDAVLAAA